MLTFCSSFYHEQAFFGGFPNEEQFQELLENHFEYFIDLTTLRERDRLKFDYSLEIPKYKNLVYINYSIIDNNVPLSENVFSEILNLFQNILKTKKRIYIHCKGGHGRSSLLVAALLCHLHFYTPYKALHFTKSYHEKRNNLKDKYRGKPCPQLYHQRKFVIDLFKNRAKIKFN